MSGNSLRFGEAYKVYRQFSRIVPAVIFINVRHVCKPVPGFHDSLSVLNFFRKISRSFSKLSHRIFNKFVTSSGVKSCDQRL